MKVSARNVTRTYGSGCCCVLYCWTPSPELKFNALHFPTKSGPTPTSPQPKDNHQSKHTSSHLSRLVTESPWPEVTVRQLSHIRLPRMERTVRPPPRRNLFQSTRRQNPTAVRPDTATIFQQPLEDELVERTPNGDYALYAPQTVYKHMALGLGHGRESDEETGIPLSCSIIKST